MTWWVALVVAFCAGMALACVLLALVPTEGMGKEGEKNAGLSLLAGAFVTLALYVVLVQA